MNDATWIVVAGEGRARIFSVEAGSSALQQVDDISNAHDSATRLSDKMAEAYAEDERKEKERDKFAFEVARYVDDARSQGKFGSVKLAADPKFLGMMLTYLSEQTQKTVVEKINKDYSGLSTKEIEAVLQRS